MWSVALADCDHFQVLLRDFRSALIERDERVATKALLQLQQDINYLVDSLKGE